jgi:DNA-binding NtrC family response regulator
MVPETQVKFLRVLDAQEFTRLGGDEIIKTDVRIIAATNADLEEAVKTGKFRDDLYYRINRFPIRVLPLRERREDIPLLVSAFIKEFSKEHDRPVTEITPEAMNYLKNADWPGNVRELRNVIETAVILATTLTIKLSDLSSEFQNEVSTSLLISDETVGKVGMTMEEIEKEAIGKTLEETNGNKKRAAEMLGIGLRTLYRKLESYGWLNKRDQE